MDKDLLPKRHGGKRRGGKTRVKWLDIVEGDAANTGLGRDHEEAAADRTRWRNMVLGIRLLLNK
jgi:hypothetical protein